MTVPTEALGSSQLVVGYRAGRSGPRAVLTALDLSLRPGELVCLLGANGTGKSTLLRTLAGMQKPLAGIVRIDGRALGELSANQRARRLSIVLTDRVEVGNLSGDALVALGRAPHTGWSGRLSDYDRRVVHWALAMTGAEPLATRPVDALSDGERQRLMVARALAQQPRVMLLDEPTAFLDAPRRAELTGMLRGLARRSGIAVLLSTHDVELALRNADGVWLLLPSGEMVCGAPEDLVLDGVFENAFAGRDYAFDALAGGFQVRSRPDRRALVTGEGVAAVWTRRALARCGYQALDVDNGIPAEIEVICEQTADGHRWRVTTPIASTQYEKLADLVSGLRDDENGE